MASCWTLLESSYCCCSFRDLELKPNMLFCVNNSTYPGSAEPNKDYISLRNFSVVVPQGQTTGNITVSILNDSIPELSETFSVVLEYVKLIGPSTGFSPRLGALQRANVTILHNDDVHGLFVIKANSADQGSDGTMVTVAENENLAVELTVSRLGGKLNSSITNFS